MCSAWVARRDGVAGRAQGGARVGHLAWTQMPQLSSPNDSMGPPFAARVRASLCHNRRLQANKRAQGLGLDAGDRTRTCDLRIMVPARFGLAIGNSEPVGH